MRPATDALGQINRIPTRGAGVTAAAGTSLSHHLFAKLFTLGKKPSEAEHFGFPYHTCVHCKGFAPAAPRRARASISVPFSGLLLSEPLQIFGLVGRYPANSLICRRPILRHCFFRRNRSRYSPLSGVNLSFPRVFQT